MARAWLSLGANIGDPPAQLNEAIKQLTAHETIKVVSQSALLINPAWGKTDQPDFHNLILEITTRLTPIALLDACQAIETKMGRVRGEKWGPRLIDIDLVAYDKVQMDEQRLTLPHIHAHARDFVMIPLREIAPDMANWILEVASSQI